MNTPSKRVVCLYRVSKKDQMDENDILMQKIACREFADKQGWQFVKEYYEMGVSGYKLTLKDRDGLQRVMSDAHNGLYDVLLVFMFDRLGRNEEETPYIVEWLVSNGIEVWSTQEGQQKIESQMDRVLNYNRFRQSADESNKTSIRIKVKHEQMVKAGQFRGGSPPYGYRLEKSGEFNKRGKELLKLAINVEEAQIVKKIFDLVYLKEYGSNRIANYLNDNQIPTKTGILWNSSVVTYILKNPIYKGHMVFGRNVSSHNKTYRQDNSKWTLSGRPNDELIIIPEAVWDKVQFVRASRSFSLPYNGAIENENIKIIKNPKSPLLFIGMIFCGYCGSPLTTTKDYKVWTNRDGTINKRRRNKYRCSGKSLSKLHCEGQTTYAQGKIEDIVLEEVNHFLSELGKCDLPKKTAKFMQHR